MDRKLIDLGTTRGCDETGSIKEWLVLDCLFVVSGKGGVLGRAGAESRRGARKSKSSKLDDAHFLAVRADASIPS